MVAFALPNGSDIELLAVPGRRISECPRHGSGLMLAEMFMLRLEAVFRASNTPAGTNSDNRFVPLKLPGNPAKNLPSAKSA